MPNTSPEAKGQEMAFDEESFVARFVANGGDIAMARATAARMRYAEQQNTDEAVARAAAAQKHLEEQEQEAGGLLPNEGDASKDKEKTPPKPPALSPLPLQSMLTLLVSNIPTPEVSTPTVDAPPSSTRKITPVIKESPEADLFGDKPSQSEASSPRRGIAKSLAPVKRGRKPVAFDDKSRARTQRELDLFHLSMEIEEKNAKATGDLGFIATAMIYASLPHSEVEGAVFKRRNGAHTLTILNDPDIGLPYGKIPRIITAFLCTEAKRHAETRGREIHLGHSQKEFMQKLGLRSTGGERGDISRVRDQAKRLFTSNISLTGEPGAQFHWESVRITRKGMMLWNPQNFEERSRWQSQLLLTEEFFDECISHSVPIDLRVLHKLRSPLAIDIYVWLTYRYNSIAMPTPVSWKQLQWQFGANYTNTPQGERDFKANFRKQLRNVLAVYREAKMDVRQDVLLLLPSPPHVPDAA